MHYVRALPWNSSAVSHKGKRTTIFRIPPNLWPCPAGGFSLWGIRFPRKISGLGRLAATSAQPFAAVLLLVGVSSAARVSARRTACPGRWRHPGKSGAARLNLDLGAELDDLPGRHAEERRGAFGVALQEGEHRFAPHPHAGNVLARDDGLAADVIGDVGEIDAGQLARWQASPSPS